MSSREFDSALPSLRQEIVTDEEFGFGHRGYRIRALTAAEKEIKVSQIVARQREWEDGLVSTYKKFLEVCEHEVTGEFRRLDLAYEPIKLIWPFPHQRIHLSPLLLFTPFVPSSRKSQTSTSVSTLWISSSSELVEKVGMM